MRSLYTFARDTRAATSIEYAVIAMLVSITIVGAVGLVGSRLQTSWYNKIATNLT